MEPFWDELRMPVADRLGPESRLARDAVRRWTFTFVSLVYRFSNAPGLDFHEIPGVLRVADAWNI